LAGRHLQGFYHLRTLLRSALSCDEWRELGDGFPICPNNG
jgi:hypothetical protein